jgi:hypothetical protein
MIYIAAIACKKTDEERNELWKKQIEACKETWVKTLIPGDEVHFIYGDTELKSINYDDFLNQNPIIDSIDIFYNVPDGIGSKMLYKTLSNMIDFLKTDHQFYFRTHTGSFINLKILNSFSKNLLNNTNIVSSVLGTYTGNELYLSGSGLLISRNIIEQIIKNLPQHLDFIANNTEYPEDVYLGKTILAMKPTIIHSNRKDVSSNIFTKEEIESIYHYYFVTGYKHNIDIYYTISDLIK